MRTEGFGDAGQPANAGNDALNVALVHGVAIERPFGGRMKQLMRLEIAGDPFDIRLFSGTGIVLDSKGLHQFVKHLQ